MILTDSIRKGTLLTLSSMPQKMPTGADEAISRPLRKAALSSAEIRRTCSRISLVSTALSTGVIFEPGTPLASRYLAVPLV